MPNLSSHRQNPTLVAIGSAIRRIRKERCQSQEDVAHTAQVDVSYLGRVERGDNNVAILKLQSIASALGLTLSELMSEAEV